QVRPCSVVPIVLNLRCTFGVILDSLLLKARVPRRHCLMLFLHSLKYLGAAPGCRLCIGSSKDCLNSGITVVDRSLHAQQSPEPGAVDVLYAATWLVKDSHQIFELHAHLGKLTDDRFPHGAEFLSLTHCHLDRSLGGFKDDRPGD